MKVLLGVLLCAYLISASLYHRIVDQFLKDLPVTKFDYPGFAERNYTDDETRDCIDRKGKFVDGEFVGNRTNYDILDILKSLGGAPGEVKAERRNVESEPTVADPNERPLEDAPEDKWLYDYRVTDYRFYYRLEHAVKRFAGTNKEFLDIRGELGWTPEDTCGRMKVAYYRQDDTGFKSIVDTGDCNFVGYNRMACTTIPSCHTKTQDDGFTMTCVG